MMLVMALTITMIVGTSADNCAIIATNGKVGPHTVKTEHKDLYCTKAASASGDGCGGCCAPTPGLCYTLAKTGDKLQCDDAHMLDSSMASYAKAATTANFKTTCCKKKPTCTGYACATYGYKDKADMTGTCSGESGCDTTKCCDTDATKCAAGEYSSPGVPRSCGTGKTFDSAKVATTMSADFSDFETNCCKTAIAAPKCDITCPAGYEKRADYATATCRFSPCHADDDKWNCCATKKLTCNFAAGVVEQDSPPSTAKKCGTTEFYDKAKAGSAAKDDGSDFKTNCCSPKSTCAAFKAATNIGSASPANTQHASAMLLLVLGAGILA